MLGDGFTNEKHGSVQMGTFFLPSAYKTGLIAFTSRVPAQY